MRDNDSRRRRAHHSGTRSNAGDSYRRLRAAFFYDPVTHGIGLAHSGRKGTEANIAGATLRAMKKHFGSDPAHILVLLGPCIRPPHYEIDFAATIAAQCRAEGVIQYEDCGLNTGSDLQRFFSYRVEKGQTGRHYSALALLPGAFSIGL